MSKVKGQVTGIRVELLLALVFVAVTLGSVFAELRGLQAYVSSSVWFHAIVIGELIIQISLSYQRSISIDIIRFGC